MSNLYKCDPKKNKECKKRHCYINDGPCSQTTNKEYEKRRNKKCQ